jgi:hypothetical protein
MIPGVPGMNSHGGDQDGQAAGQKKKMNRVYERLSAGAKEDFFIISFPNTIWDEKKCIPEEIVVVKCVPYFGGFQVDYFKSGE